MTDYWHREKRRKESRRVKLAAFLVAAIALSLGMILGAGLSKNTIIIYNSTATNEGCDDFFMQPLRYEELLSIGESSFAAVKIPAVDEEENGVVTVLTVQAIPGSGRVLADIDKLIFWADTQNSIRKATMVAANITGIDLSKYDLIYELKANATVVGGPSAGAAITIATIAALTNDTVNNSFMITGSINHDGTLGPVGGIFEKALASKASGADIMLVPLTQSTQISYKNRKYCEKIGWMDFCTTETYPVKIDIEEEADILVKEVMTIQDAMVYMIN